MIHQVYLPEITRKRLTDVVALQVLLLSYAATRDTLNEESATTYLDRFLRRFYVDLCSATGLPNCIFSEPGTGYFGRQDLLAAFKEANHHLQICAVCDETGYHTMVGGHIYAELDHYLPESMYPHLACHPFNFIPICSYCNVMIKGRANPLQGSSRNRLSVEDIFLPYREPGLGSRTYLQVRLGAALTEAEFGELRPREESNLSSRLERFRRVYKIPDRWRQRVDQIGPQLLKRIREFLRGITVSALNARSLLNELDDLLYSFHEDQGSEPFACAKMWWLAALINDEVEPAMRRPQHVSDLISPLVEEINAMLQLDRRARGDRPRESLHTSSARIETARHLRGLLRRAR
jgi:hypothetical protein